MSTYFRLQPPNEDPETLLEASQQTSEPWSGTVMGRCDKCGGEGETEHECESCKPGSADPDCPACHGEVRYRDECPACEGSGEIDDSHREGVSVFPEEEGLYRYMVKRDADIENSVLVELEAEPSEDEDFDADEGALLVRPTRIVRAGAPDAEKLARVREELGE